MRVRVARRNVVGAGPHAVRDHPGFHHVAVSFDIVEDGSVQGVSVPARGNHGGPGEAFRSCVAAIVSVFEFPSPHEEQSVQTNFNLVPPDTIREYGARRFEGRNTDIEDCYEQHARSDADGEVELRVGVGRDGTAADVVVVSSDFTDEVGSWIREFIDGAEIVGGMTLGPDLFADTDITQHFTFDPQPYAPSGPLTSPSPPAPQHSSVPAAVTAHA